MKRFVLLRYFVALFVCTIIGFALFSSPANILFSLPNTIYMTEGQKKELAIPLLKANVDGESIQISSNTSESIANKGIEVQSVQTGDSKIDLKLAGVTVKRVAVKVYDENKLIPGGNAVGVTFYTKGALVVGTSEIMTTNKRIINPAKDAGIIPGDVIISIDGIEIDNSLHLTNLLNAIENRNVMLSILRDGVKQSVIVTPQYDAQDGKLKMGLWVRDSTAGVGTMTFFDAKSKTFGALGHAITDIDTQSNLLLKYGEIVEAQIIDVVHGEKGQPGELRGNFRNTKHIGGIEQNTDFGIFGSTYEYIENPIYPDGVMVGLQDSVHLGKAEILSTIDNNGIQKFECEIIRTQPQSRPSQRGMIIKITDPVLLKKTGGIIQGMSGSPIIQDGRLIGAVTHVFVNDPTRGYGMYIEWMLGQTA